MKIHTNEVYLKISCIKNLISQQSISQSITHNQSIDLNQVWKKIYEKALFLSVCQSVSQSSRELRTRKFACPQLSWRISRKHFAPQNVCMFEDTVPYRVHIENLMNNSIVSMKNLRKSEACLQSLRNLRKQQQLSRNCITRKKLYIVLIDYKNFSFVFLFYL